MKNRTIFGIAGQLGSGKDTVCDILYELGLIPKENIVGFAKGVKECVQEYFGISITERTTKSRLAWQRIGDIFRELHVDLHGNKDVWINYLFSSFKEDESYAISDVRYVNEMQSILNEDGMIIYLEIPHETRRKRVNSRRKIPVSDEEWQKMNSHESEREVHPSYFKQIKPFLKPQNKIIIVNNDLKNINQLKEKIQTQFMIEDS